MLSSAQGAWQLEAPPLLLTARSRTRNSTIAFFRRNGSSDKMLNAKRPHFFEVFNRSLSSERLKIPARFLKHMEGRTSGSVSLIGPSGKTWHVDLILDGDGLFLQDGWPTFVGDHFIESGDSLVFRYDGNLNFTVQVFDTSACEKEGAFCAECSQDESKLNYHVGDRRERDTAAVLLYKIFEGVPKKMRGIPSHVSSDCITNNREAKVDLSPKKVRPREELLATETCKGASSEETKKSSMPMKNSMPSISTACDEKPEEIIRKRTSKDSCLGLHARGCMLKKLSAREEKKAAQAFNSHFPNFVRIMKRFNISGSHTLKIPYQFSKAHLPKCKIKIVLCNAKGECWTVNSIPTTGVHTIHTLCGGWMAFVRGNDIKMGDTCIFELVRKCELRVHILGAGEDGLDCKSGNAASTTSHKACDELNLTLSSSQGHLECLHETEISDKKGFQSDKVLKTRQVVALYHDKMKHHSTSKSSTRSSLCCQSEAWNKQPGYMLMWSTPEEEIVARSFSSPFPYFVRFMKKFNISRSYILKIPCHFSLTHLPKCKTKVALHNLEGECWSVNSVPATKGQAVHTFCGGWMAFVSGNNVKMGDVCIFELIGQCEMRVQILRIGKKVPGHQTEKHVVMA
ncbi:B3 domain-containing protein Os01g0723500-like [Malania oleifera]|uniref:B3 domain-containing protein Os01g0723500-like n=1 Tax=Malania oleifera TaxID=397392 RepID=UPI0025ADBDA0|nr:B3 domain-containing protein Os01g0723500-like [Malania oleifera]